MTENAGKRSNNRCAIYGTSGAFGKLGYNTSLGKTKETIKELIASGINTFVTEARDGFELELSVYIQDLKKNNPEIHLVVAKPYPNFNTNLRTKPILQSVMKNADMVKYIAEKEEEYSSELLDQWILNHCDTLLYITRTLSETINRLSGFDLSDKRIVYIPERPDNNGIDKVYSKGQKWIPEEESKLIERVNQGLTITEIALLHGRTVGAIRSRLRKLGYDVDNIDAYHVEDNDDKKEEPGFAIGTQGSSSIGINLNEIVIAAQQVPGRASFDNYDELKSYLRSGLQPYNSTAYSLDNIDQARRDHFVLKNVRKKLSDTKKAIQKEYSMPVEMVIRQLDELIGMVNEPFSSLDRMLKMNAKEIKRRDIMSYAQSKAYALGKYANSVIQSPAFFNPRWCNASYSDAKWKREVDEIVKNAEESIDYILNSDVDDVGIVLGYYLDKLSLSGIDSFLQNVRREEKHREPETVFIDINTGEIVEKVGETTLVDHNENEGTRPEAEHDPAADPASDELKEAERDVQEATDEQKKIQKRVMLIGKQEQIEEFISMASQYGIEVEDIV